MKLDVILQCDLKCWYVFSQNSGLYSLGWYMNLFLGYWFPNILQIIRLLANHPQFKITLMTADRKAGQSIESVFPHLVSQVRISVSSLLYYFPYFLWEFLWFYYTFLFNYVQVCLSFRIYLIWLLSRMRIFLLWMQYFVVYHMEQPRLLDNSLPSHNIADWWSLHI